MLTWPLSLSSFYITYFRPHLSTPPIAIDAALDLVNSERHKESSWETYKRHKIPLTTFNSKLCVVLSKPRPFYISTPVQHKSTDAADLSRPHCCHAVCDPLPDRAAAEELAPRVISFIFHSVSVRSEKVYKLVLHFGV